MCTFIIKELIVFWAIVIVLFFITLNVTRIKPRLLNILSYGIKGLTQPKKS